MIVHPKAALSSLAVLAKLASCPAVPAPEVALHFTNTPPAYINDRPSTELGRFRTDTVFSHGTDEIFITGGLTESNIAAGVEYGYKTLTSSKDGNGCVWLTRLDIDVSYKPTVYIASGFRPGSCRYRTTAEHELRHVGTDVVTLNEYLPSLKKAVADVTSSIGVQGPSPPAGIARARDLFAAAVRTELQRRMDEIERVRMMRQQQIDTRQEYLRLSKACPGEPVRGR